MNSSKNVISYTPKAFVGKQAPAFSGTVFHEDKFSQISNSTFAGKWVVLFFYPLDFTFVCPTEICNFSDSSPLFKSLSKSIINKYRL